MDDGNYEDKHRSMGLHRLLSSPDIHKNVLRNVRSTPYVQNATRVENAVKWSRVCPHLFQNVHVET